MADDAQGRIGDEDMSLISDERVEELLQKEAEFGRLRNATIEECARVAETAWIEGRNPAAAIRALKDKKE